jgi:hypothetical protein
MAATDDLASLRERMIALLHDCPGLHADRMRSRLQRMPSIQDLWLARCDVFQLIARTHCESIAALRIQSLTTSARAVP